MKYHVDIADAHDVMREMAEAHCNDCSWYGGLDECDPVVTDHSLRNTAWAYDYTCPECGHLVYEVAAYLPSNDDMKEVAHNLLDLCVQLNTVSKRYKATIEFSFQDKLSVTVMDREIFDADALGEFNVVGCFNEDTGIIWKGHIHPFDEKLVQEWITGLVKLIKQETK